MFRLIKYLLLGIYLDLSDRQVCRNPLTTKYMKSLIFVLPLFLILQSDGCSSDDDTDNRSIVETRFIFDNIDADCIEETLTYIIEGDDTQRSIDVVDNDRRILSFVSREGEIFLVTVVRTNDPTNEVLASTNIVIEANPNDPDSRFVLFANYNGCNSPIIQWDWDFD